MTSGHWKPAEERNTGHLGRTEKGEVEDSEQRHIGREERNTKSLPSAISDPRDSYLKWTGEETRELKKQQVQQLYLTTSAGRCTDDWVSLGRLSGSSETPGHITLDPQVTVAIILGNNACLFSNTTAQILMVPPEGSSFLCQGFRSV